MMKRLLGLLLVCLLFLSSCAPQSPQGGKSPNSGLGLAALGLVNLILSPIQIAAGVLQGIASVPFYLNMNPEQINAGLIAANAKVTLDDTYESAYGKRISAVPQTGDTGEVFRRMKHASEYFQKVLTRYGVKDAGHYFLTSIDTANNQGYTLFAVIYRPSDSVTVIDKYDGKTVRTFTREDRLYYEPFARDAQGRPLDTVIDWAGLARDFYATQKAQAVLITMAANAVVNEKRSLDYWDIENRWIAGEFEAIVEQRMNSVKNKMKL
ncbi:MAG: hypothetical protein M0009_07470 [Deltaproteobacteria bacterium]|nr:hypothetical protein [Deltaproteobacteria bacterium]